MSKSPKKKNESNQIEEILGFGNYSTRKSYYPELQKSIEELKESETKYKSFLATSPDAIVVTDLAGIVTFSNPKFEQIHGLEREGEWIGKSALELIAEEDKQRILESIQHIISNGLVENLEFNLLKKDGSVFPAEISGNVIKDKDGNPQSLLIISRDISDRKQVEDALKSLSSSYVNLKGKDFFEAISEHIAVSMNLDYVYVGKLLADDMIEVAGGFALGEKMGDLSYDLENTPCRNVIDQEFRLHPSGIQKSFPKDQLLIDLNIDGYIGSPLINYNGESIGIIVGLSIKPINNIEIVQQYFKIFIDRIVAEIAKSKAEEALLLSEDRLSKIMIAANDGLWDWYIKSGYTYFDPRYYTMAGYEVDEFPHRLEEFQKRVHPDDINFVMDQAEQHIRGEIDRFKIEFRFKKKDGSWLWVLARGIIVEYDSENKPARFVGTHTNITDRKKAEEALTASQLRFEALFNDSPVPLWEEDFTEVYKFLNSLKQNGVEDFGAHFNKNPEDVFRCSHLIKIENVNSAALSLHEANSKEELLGNLDKIFTDRS